MKCIAIFVLLAATFTCSLAAKRCRSADDCDEGQCCLARFWLGFKKGDCTDLGKEGATCLSDEAFSFHYDAHVFHCPCAPGLSCEPTETAEVPLSGTDWIHETCVKREPTEPATA